MGSLYHYTMRIKIHLTPDAVAYGTCVGLGEGGEGGEGDHRQGYRQRHITFDSSPIILPTVLLYQYINSYNLV